MAATSAATPCILRTLYVSGAHGIFNQQGRVLAGNQAKAGAHCMWGSQGTQGDRSRIQRYSDKAYTDWAP
jgi:predicted alpha/beta hydrolase